MPRSYANFTTAIWRDEDFLELTATQQQVYFMLSSQPEITAAGALAITLKRWARLSKGMTVEALETELEVLADRGFVVIDDDTEELLVRTFVKADLGYQNSKRRPVILAAALGIGSPILRAAIAIEFIKLGLADMASQVRGIRHTENQDAVSPSDRVVVTEVSTNHNPQTTHHNPESANQGRGPNPIPNSPPPLGCPKHPNGTDQPCPPCADARRTRQAWDNDEPNRRAATATAATQARTLRDNCTQCHGTGWTETHNGHPAAKCHHRPIDNPTTGGPFETASTT